MLSILIPRQIHNPSQWKFTLSIEPGCKQHDEAHWEQRYDNWNDDDWVVLIALAKKTKKTDAGSSHKENQGGWDDLSRISGKFTRFRKSSRDYFQSAILWCFLPEMSLLWQTAWKDFLLESDQRKCVKSLAKAAVQIRL